MRDSINPYCDLTPEDSAQIHIFVPREEYDLLRSTCLGRGDMRAYLSFLYSQLVHNFIIPNKLHEQYEPTSREAVRSFVSRIQLCPPTQCGPNIHDGRRTPHDCPQVPVSPVLPTHSSLGTQNGGQEGDGHACESAGGSALI